MGAIENYLKTADLAPWLSQPQARPGVLQNLQQLAAGAKGPARPPPVPAAALRGAVPGAQGMMPRINQALMSNLKHASYDAARKFGLDKLALGMPGFMNTLMQAGRQGAGAGLARFQNVGGTQGALQGLQRGAQDFHAMGGSGALGKALGLGAAGAAGLYGAGRMFGAGQQAARPQQDPRMGQQRPMR